MPRYAWSLGTEKQLKLANIKGSYITKYANGIFFISNLIWKK